MSRKATDRERNRGLSAYHQDKKKQHRFETKNINELKLTMKVQDATKKPKKQTLEPNPSNTWQQHPNIKSPIARSRAYLIEAGLIQNESKVKKNLALLDPHIDLINSPEAKFGRLLASPDQRVRHGTIQKLSIYLKKRCDPSNENGGISELDLLKLWKGLWYTLYLCDKAPVQDDVSKKLCQLVWSFSGTDEEDEYAGRLYLEMEQEEFDGDDENLIGGEEEEEESDDLFMGTDDGDVSEDEDGLQEESSQEDDNLYLSSKENDDKSDSDNDKHRCDEENYTHDHDHNSVSSIDDYEMKHCRGAHLVSLYIRTFFRTVRREWSNMDKYRVDKFYTCMRYMLRETYMYMSKRNWALGIIRLLNDTIFEEILSQTPNGPRYHLIDIALDELVHVSTESTLPLTEATFIDCMEPFFALLQILDDATVHARIVENILQRFLLQYSVLNQNEIEIKEASLDIRYIFTQVHVGTIAEFIFDIASNENTQDRYRKVLYDTHKQYMKRLRDVGRDVVIESDSNSQEDSAEDDEDINDTDDQKITRNRTEVNNIPIQTNAESIGHKKVKAGNKRVESKTLVSPDDHIKQEKGTSRKLLDPTTNLKFESVAVIDKVESTGMNEATKSQQKKRDKPDMSSGDNKTSIVDKKPKKSMSSDNSKGNDGSYHKPSIPTEPTVQGDDKVITISIEDQKVRAKSAFTAAELQTATVTLKVSEKSQQHSEPKPELNKKKVKFGKQNMSKSYTASLNDLRKINPKEILEKRPGESILRSPTKKRTQRVEMSKHGKKLKRHRMV